MSLPNSFADLLRPHLPFVPEHGVQEHDELRDLGLDSMGLVAIMVEIEDLYDLELPDDFVDERTFATVGTLWAAVKALLDITRQGDFVVHGSGSSEPLSDQAANGAPRAGTPGGSMKDDLSNGAAEAGIVMNGLVAVGVAASGTAVVDPAVNGMTVNDGAIDDARDRAVATRFDELLARGEQTAPAVSHHGVTLTYGELGLRVDRIAAGLRRCCLGAGDRVVVYLDKRWENVAMLLAVSRVGAVVVPLNALLRTRQALAVLADCDASLLVTTADRWARMARRPEGRLGSCRSVIVLDQRDQNPVTLEGIVVHAFEELDREDPPAEPLTASAPAAAAMAEVLSDLPVVAAIFYTSGSTGGPKGVTVTHRNLLAGARVVSGYLKQRSDDVILGLLPLAFDAGFSQLTTTLFVGGHLVLLDFLHVGEVTAVAVRHRVTALTCVPPLWAQLARVPWPPEVRLRFFASTGGPMPSTVLARLRQLFPEARPYLMYGLTEAFRSTYLDPAQIDRRPDSIGQAVPGETVVIVRPDGTPCDSNEHGELVHQGNFVTEGYWNDPAATAARFRSWPPDSNRRAVWSGDIAYRDQEGFLYFVGRADDMIKTSGYRVSPEEVEEVAYASGLVGDAVAYGVPDEILGQHIVLAVTRPDTGACRLAGLQTLLRELLPTYMVPQTIVEFDQIPRTANGKFDRGVLKSSLQ